MITLDALIEKYEMAENEWYRLNPNIPAKEFRDKYFSQEEQDSYEFSDLEFEKDLEIEDGMPGEEFFEFIDLVHEDKQISSLVKQLKKRYHQLEKQSGFDKIMKDGESAEIVSDMMDQHVEDIEANEMDIVTYLWYNA